MSTITVRRLAAEVHNAIKAQAAAEGISAEEKVRRVLSERFEPTKQAGLGDELCALADNYDLPTTGPDIARIQGDVEPASF